MSVPRAIEMAREARSTDPMLYGPSVLWQAAHDAHADSQLVTDAVYMHAMIEAGHVLDAPHEEGGKPYDPCPVCGHSFT